MTGSTLLSALRDPMPGDVIGQKYRLERCLGEGGQGCVWRAQNLVLELPVAIKLVHAEAIHGLVPERLFREARAAATLGHPSIVRVFDVGRTAEALPFLVMELLRGESLSEALARAGRLEPSHALRLLLPIADGLVAAHAEGIIHRDVKPDNIFVALHGDLIQPKLLDFGLARRNKSGDQLTRLTDAGAVLGTPAYLSPEQASGKSYVDERADIWSFCATVYECLAGIVPFQGTSWHQLRRQILKDEPASLRDFGVDAQLWEVLRQGLAKSPSERWSSMQELGRTLACWLLERGVTTDICGVSLEARWLRAEPVAVSPQAAEETRLAHGAPSPRLAARGGTHRINKSTARLRPTAPRRSSKPMAPSVEAAQPPTLPELTRQRRLLVGAALALACIASGVFLSATQPARDESGGIITPSRAATLPAGERLGRTLAVSKPAQTRPAPVVSPVQEAPAPPVAVALPDQPQPAPNMPNARRPRSAAPSVAGEPAAAPAPLPTQPAPLARERPRSEPLDLMEPY